MSTLSSIKDFYVNYFNKPDDLLDLIIQFNLIKSKVECPTCHSEIPLNRMKLEFRCQKRYLRGRSWRKCNLNKSAKAGTFFEKSHLEIEKVIEFVVLWCHLPHPRWNLLQNNTGFASATINDWSSLCREVCFQYLHEHSSKLGGPGEIVEIGEAKFGTKKLSVGQGIEEQWVFGGIQRNTRRMFLVPVEVRDDETLLNLIKEHILPGTTIISNCGRGYDCLQSEGFQHLRVNHSLNFVDPANNAVHTNNIVRVWRDVKGSIPRYGRRKEHFAGYLAEFMFKRQFKLDAVVPEFLKAVAAVYVPL